MFICLGICHENGIGTAVDLDAALSCYERATAQSPKSSVHWAHERARARLAKLYIAKSHYAKALEQLLQLVPQLEQMKGHQTSDTVMQAREARYMLGRSLQNWQNAWFSSCL